MLNLIMWEVFNVPPVQPVIYNAILSKKSKFSKLVHGYESHGLEYSKIHCCKIVSNLSALSEQQKIFIIIFADFQRKSNLCFMIKIYKHHIIDEFNKFLLFMKRIKYEIRYLISGENFYVVSKNSENWYLFYDLYKLLLSRPITTILGTQFYYTFACKNLIYNEFMLMRTCSSIMKKTEAFLSFTKAPLRSLSDVYAKENFPVLCSPTNEAKNVYDFKSDTRTRSCKVLVGKRKSSNFALNSMKRKCTNFLSNTVNHDTRIKRKEAFENDDLLWHFHQDEKEMQKFSQTFRETSYEPSCDKSLKRKLVDIQSCRKEIPLKQPKVKLPSSYNEHCQESFTFHEACDSPNQSLCKYRKWKIFSNVERFASITYMDLLSSKCDLEQNTNILKKSRMRFPKLVPSPQQMHHNFKWPQNNTLKIISTYSLNEPKEFKMEHSMLHKSMKKLNDSCISSSQIFSQVSRSKLTTVSTSANQLKENTQFHSKFSDVHALKRNENSVKSFSAFKTTGGNEILCSQTTLLTAQEVLQDVIDEKAEQKNESFHLKMSQKSYSNLAQSGNKVNCTSIGRENKDADETQMDIVVPDNFFTEECFDEKKSNCPLKVSENNIKSLNSFKSASGKQIKCSQSALLAAKKILQSISDENIEEENESLNFNISNNRNSHSVQHENNLKQNSITFGKTKEVDDTRVDSVVAENVFTKKCFDEKGAKLPSTSNENDIEPCGFKSAGGNAIKCSQSALLAAQKMFENISDDNGKDMNESLNLIPNNSKSKLVQSGNNMNRNPCNFYKNKDVDETQMDIVLPENFFTEECSDAKKYNCPLKVSENSIKSLKSLKSASGKQMKCAQSALLAAKQILQSILDETPAEKNESLNFNISNNRNSHSVQHGNNLKQNSITFGKTKEVDDTRVDSAMAENVFTKKCFDEKGAKLPSTSNENDIEPCGFKSAGGNAIKCSQSALLAAQKILENISDDNGEDMNVPLNLMPSNSKSKLVNRNSYNLYKNKNFDETQMDIVLPDNFFTEECFDFDEKDAIFPNDASSTMNIQSEDPNASNTPSNKRKKTLGTRRSLSMFPKI